jgi:hypothetical protein
MKVMRIIAGSGLGLAALLATTLLVAACSSASTSPAASSATSLASSPAAAPSTASDGSAPASTTSASTPTATPAPSSSTAPPATAASSASASAAPSASEIYIASGQTLTGTPLHKPSCAGTYGCQLSGDSTAYLAGMTWQSWTPTEAIGTGTEKLSDCTPSCAAATLYPVQVVVTFTQPVKACTNGTVRWYWTRASFAYPKGLPAALQGQNAPANPWTFTALAQSAQQSCA